jgi:hypothetical protein
MKHYILLTVIIPPFGVDGRYSKWELLKQNLENRLKTSKDIVALSENAWLLPRDSGLPFLAECIALAERYNLEHKNWFLDEA